jgi:hypothetical protein
MEDYEYVRFIFLLLFTAARPVSNCHNYRSKKKRAVSVGIQFSGL